MSRSYEKYDQVVVVFGVLMIVFLILSYANAICRGMVNSSAQADVVKMEENGLVITSPNPEVEVPDVEGLTVEDAVNELLGHGLKPGVVLPVHSPDPQGTVLAQDQPPGTSLPPGWTVNMSSSVGE